MSKLQLQLKNRRISNTKPTTHPKGLCRCTKSCANPKEVPDKSHNERTNRGAPQLMPKATAYRSTVITSPKLCQKWLTLSSSASP